MIKALFRIFRGAILGMLLLFYGVKFFISDYHTKQSINNDFEKVRGKIVDIKQIQLPQPENPLEVAPIKVVLLLDNNKYYQSNNYNDIFIADINYGLFKKNSNVTLLATKSMTSRDTTVFAGLNVEGKKYLKVEDYSPKYHSLGWLKYFMVIMGLFLSSIGVFISFYIGRSK